MSSPGYDPQLMVGLDRGKNYSKLLNDPLKPLFDRTTMAQYPPGSIFKTVQALIGLQTKAISLQTQCICSGGAYIVGGKFMKCHHHSSPVIYSSPLKTPVTLITLMFSREFWNCRNIKR